MSLKYRRVLETEPSAPPPAADGMAVSETALVAQSRTKPAAHVAWIVRGSTQAAAAHKPLTIPAGTMPADTASAIQNAQVGDTVMFSGLEIPALVEACDDLLNRGVAVELDAESFPALRGLVTSHEHGTHWVRLEPAGKDRLPQVVSRMVDTAAGVAASIAVAPLMGVLILGVLTSSPGPPIFRSPRVGRAGLDFGLYKLRTMRRPSGPDQGARKELYRDFMAVRGDSDGKSLKVVDESRVTPIGRFLRKHSLDELPQFWNVVRGDLSLVGPRPCLSYEYDLHEGWHRLRFRSRPGLTGLWQAYGRGRVTFEEMVLMDYCYSWRKSFLLDLRIVFRTALVVITGEGGA